MSDLIERAKEALEGGFFCTDCEEPAVVGPDGRGTCGHGRIVQYWHGPKASDLARALIREREAAERLAEALEHCLNEMRELIPGYSGAAVTDAQVEDDIKDEVAALAAYRAAQKETDDDA